MKYWPFFTLLVSLIACTIPTKEVTLPEPSILPKPVSVEMNPGTFELNQSVSISTTDSATQSVAEFLSTYLERIGKEVSFTEGKADITLTLTGNTQKEAYTLEIGDEGTTISAEGTPGLFYGIQSLIQVLSNNPSVLPQMVINDEPRFGYRGMHLDVARHMFPVEFVKRYIDLMAHFKYNTFHWHLTEDQGWRIEIKQYPLLQEKAAYRNETVVGHAATGTRDEATYDGQRYGGYYTQEEVKEVVAYAAARQITVVPEIELPGHSQAALTAYPHLGCTGGPYETATTWGVFPDIYCAGKESTFEFLENVFNEVIPLFPGKYVHIGGDEAPKDRWKECPHCQKRIKEEGLNDEHELQSYFVQRIEKYLNAKGKTIIGWDEILEGGLAENAVVMSWRGEEGGIEAVQQNHEVIMTPVGWCYFDYYQADPENEPLAFPNQITVEKVYGYEPIPEELTKEQEKLVLGAQCNLWSEYIPNGKQAEYQIYPRAIAMSEVLWSEREENRDFKSFVNRVSNIRPLMDQWKINYATHIFEEE
ncbi:MAG: beta-N-acetylhexosaminidase [Marinoscillum sp.]